MPLTDRLRPLTALLAATLALTLVPTLQPAHAADNLPPIVFVGRAHLATKDFIFENDLGPAGQLTTGLNKFAPGSKLIVRETGGQLRVLIDTGAASPPRWPPARCC